MTGKSKNVSKGNRRIVRLVVARTVYSLGEKTRVGVSASVSENLKVVDINYSAGTSGVEYLVEFEDKSMLQFRGYQSYQATWKEVEDE